MTKEKEIEEKYGNLTLREVGISGIAYKMGQNSQKEKDLEMIEEQVKLIPHPSEDCRECRFLREFVEELQQKIKGEK